MSHRSKKLERRRAWWRTVIETQCVRCHKPQPDLDNPEHNYWEALDDSGAMICPDCITDAERQSLDESDMDVIEQLDGEP